VFVALPLFAAARSGVPWCERAKEAEESKIATREEKKDPARFARGHSDPHYFVWAIVLRSPERVGILNGR